jgi:hypothetical protein
MSNQAKPIQRFLRRLHRSLFHTVPNPGIEVDLSKLKPPTTNDADLEFSLEWNSPEQPSDPVGNSKT